MEPLGHAPQPRFLLLALGCLTMVLGAIAYKYGDAPQGDPRRTLILIGLGYLTLVVAAVYLDYRFQLWRAKKRRETKQVDKEQ